MFEDINNKLNISSSSFNSILKYKIDDKIQKRLDNVR